MKIIKLYEESQFETKRNKDLCYDCYAVVLENDIYHIEDGKKFYNLEPGESKKVSLGIKVGFDEGEGGNLEERSGLASRGIEIGGGQLDEDFIGEVFAIVRNKGRGDFRVYTGTKICQLRIVKNIHREVEYVDSLEETERGEKGFGSTDKV